MNTTRITFTALALAAFGVAHAGEITEFPLDKGSKSRAEVRSQARDFRASNELYDGSNGALKAGTMSTRSREEVRMEAALSRTTMDPVVRNDQVGGM